MLWLEEPELRVSLAKGNFNELLKCWLTTNVDFRIWITMTLFEARYNSVKFTIRRCQCNDISAYLLLRSLPNRLSAPCWETLFHPGSTNCYKLYFSRPELANFLLQRLASGDDSSHKRHNSQCSGRSSEWLLSRVYSYQSKCLRLPPTGNQTQT